MKTALITGAAGYLGSHLAKSLKQSGWKVVGLGHKRHTMNQYLDIMHYADVRNIDDVDDLFSRIKFDVVFHLAARIEAGVSFKEPTEFYSVNTGGTCNDYIPNYNSCNLNPSFDYENNENIENFACPCSNRYKNYSKIGCPYNKNCPCGINCTCGINCSCN